MNYAPVPSVKQLSKRSKSQKFRRNRRNRSKKKKNELQAAKNLGYQTTSTNLPNAQTIGEDMWLETYQSLIGKILHWKNIAQNYQMENQKLRELLIPNSKIELNNEYTDESSGDSENEFIDEEFAEDDETEQVDEDYLKFIQITEAHRENLRLQRLAEQNTK